MINNQRLSTLSSSFPHKSTDQPAETLHPNWLMELMEQATIDLRRHPHEGLWDFLERKADYFKLQNARYDEKLTNLNRSPEQEYTYRNEVTRDGFRYTRSNDAEKILLRNLWEQENLRQGTRPGAFDLDEDGQLKTRLIEINFKHVFDYLHGTPALAEWNNMLLARLLPPEDYVQIMSLPKAQRWHAIDEQTRGKDLALVPLRPASRMTKPNTIIREKDGKIGYFRLTDEHSHRSDELTAGSSEENSPEWILAAQGRRHTGYDIRTPYGTRADKQKILQARILSDEKARDLGRRNGFTGGCLNGDVPAGAHGPDSPHIPLAEYTRMTYANKPKIYEDIFHEAIHAVTPSPDAAKGNSLISSVPGVPKDMYFSRFTEMTGALAMTKLFSAQVLKKVPNCASDLRLIYEGLWLPDDFSHEADIHRSHLPDGIRRLFMHLDAMRRNGTLQEFLQWLDENNLMNQVSNEYMPSDWSKNLA